MKIPTVKVVLINKNALNLKVTIPNTETYKFKNLERKIDPLQWDRKAGQCKKGHKDCELINRYIFEERNKIVAAFEDDLKNKVVFTEAHIVSRLKGLYMDVAQDFYAFCRERIATMNYSSETRRTYYTEVTKMEQYSPALAFADIDYKFLEKYENYMRSTLNNHSNTVWKSLKFVNRMLNLAIKHGGIIDKSPMDDYDRGQYKQGIPLYLEWSDAQAIHKALLTKKMTEAVKLTGYYALLSYYGGLRFADSVSFDYSKKVIEDTTGKRLVLYAQKNGEIVSISFNKYITEVVEYIKDKPITTSNQEFNTNLKAIAGIAGLSEVLQKEISSHCFRHGYAMRCAELGMMIEDVQKLMGHNKRSSTEIYFRVKNKRLDQAMQVWES